ncbi:MAG: hypothetical protein HY916_11345 [Desulfovibrio sp.]|jgi:hypothetical protein|nr:hypothetical protein [Desulfovibrio sp.]
MSRIHLQLQVFLLALASILPGAAYAASAGQALEIYYTANTYGEFDPCPT